MVLFQCELSNLSKYIKIILMYSGVHSRLRSLDIYRKLPTDLTEPTMSGALISIIGTVCMIILFVTEL